MSKGVRLIVVAILFIFLFSAVVVFNPKVEETDGYTNYNIRFTSDNVDYRSGYAQRRYISGNNYYSRQTFNYMLAGGYYNSGTDWGYYRGWMPISIPDIDRRTLVGSATVSFRPSYIGNSQTVYFYMLNFDPQNSLSGEGIYNGISSSIYLGSRSITSTSTTYTFSLTSTALSYLKTKIASQDDYVFFGAYGSNYNGYLYFYANSNSYLTINGDKEAPNPPSIYSLPGYTTTEHIPLDWADSSDRPTAPNYGGVTYQAGAFSTTNANDLIWSSPWQSSSRYNIYGLPDGGYYFRARAKDAGGWESAWSSNYAYSFLDRKMPTTPQIMALPEYTKGTTVDLSWTISTDSGSGVKSYTVQWSTRSDFTDGGINVVNSPGTSRQYSGLTSGNTYYFIIAANDNALLRSGASAIRYTTIDTDPPTIPVMMSEPPYTKGQNNNFSWHPSIDQGIGVQWYKIQVSTTENFLGGGIVYDRFVTETFANFDGLDDETKYYARVKAIDEFLYESEWSDIEWSIQDHKGPGELGLEPLMEYLPEGPVWLGWEGAVDNSSGVDHYEVLWSTDPNFINEVHSRDHVLGQSFQIPELAPETTWYIKVRSYDALGNPGIGEITYTTIDSQPPTQPKLDAMDEFTGGRTTTVSWSDSTDPLSGFDHYVLNVYTSQDRVGLGFTLHTTDTSFEVPGLADGTTYYYEVVAYDKAGNEIHSVLVHSTQDSMGPSVPSLVPLKEYHSDPLVRVEWGPSTDDSGGDVEYRVQWSDSVLFTGSLYESPWLTGTNYRIHNTYANTRAGSNKEPLVDGTYYVRVRSRDQFGQISAWGNAVKVTIDTTAPQIPTISDLPEYSGGSTVKVSWLGVVEGPGLEMEYSILVYENETEDPVMETPWTDGLSTDVTDLKAHMTYFFRVKARDHLGWVSDPSDPTSTTMDVTGPKVTIADNGIFGKSDAMIKGDATDQDCGVFRVELSYDGGYSWSDCAYANEKWSFLKNDLPQGTSELLIRGHDAGGNIGNPVKAYIDEEAPTIIIHHPLDDGMITGPTQVTGSIMDPHLKTYSISYQIDGSEEWVDIVPSQSAAEFSGILGTWDPDGLSGGEYKIRISAVDAVDQSFEKIINITLAGANLNIDPAQITFSNSHPLPDEKVEIMVTVSNFGDSPAGDVTVTIYDGEKVLHTETGVDIPANGLVVITTDLKVSGTHKITARATSDLYDSGAMSNPSVLQPTEKEMILENFGGIFGLLALLLAIAAIILVFVFREKKERQPNEKEEKIEDKKEERKEGVQRAPPMGPAIKEEPKISLPTSPAAQKPRLPTPTVPKPALPGATVTRPPPPQQQQTPSTYTPPPQEGQKKPEVQLPNL